MNIHSTSPIIVVSNRLPIQSFQLFTWLLCTVLFFSVDSANLLKESQDNATPSGLSTDAPPSDSVMGVYSQAAVAADGKPCATIGGDIIRANGTAVDAAIAVSFCLGVVVPESLGIGGGFFATYYDKATKKVSTMDCRETAPSASTVDMYKGDPKLSAYGGKSVAVPGATRCYWQLYQKYGGGVPWRAIIDPSVVLCEEGYPVSSHLAIALQAKREIILSEPTMSDFINPSTNDVWLKGDILKLPILGATHRVLQAEPDALLSGSLTNSFLQDLKDIGSIITREDLNNYQPIWRDPIKVTLQNGGYSLYSLPPPSSGLILGSILNVLDNYNFTSESINEANIVTTYQRIVETFKHAYGERTLLGDESIVNMTSIRDLISESYAYKVYKNITDNSTSSDPAYYGAITYNPDSAGTSNMGVIDVNGNAIAITNTINTYFGAVVTSPSTGVVLIMKWTISLLQTSPTASGFLRHQLTSSVLILSAFDLLTRYHQRKRPLSSMCPTIVTDSNGDLVLVTGAAGGSIITTATAWQIMNYLWFGKNLKESVDVRRLHHQLLPMLLRYEPNFRMDIVDQLEAFGHNATQISFTASLVAVTCLSQGNDGTLYAMSDFRKVSSCTDGF